VHSVASRVALFAAGLFVGALAMHLWPVSNGSGDVHLSGAQVQEVEETEAPAAPEAPATAVAENAGDAEARANEAMPASNDDDAVRSAHPASSRASRDRSSHTSNDEATLEIRRPKGARVLVDGAPVTKRIPFADLKLTSGTHRVTIIASKQKKTVTLTVQPGAHAVLDDRGLERRSSR
jgi:hypothetical protein